MVSFPEQSFEETNTPYQDTMTLDTDSDLELHFSFGEVKSALGEIRERLDDIHMGEVHYRHSGNTLLLLLLLLLVFSSMFYMN